MSAGLATPLHLAAGLLAVSATVGLLIASLERVGGVPWGRDPHPVRTAEGTAAVLVGLGSAAYVVGALVDGALLPGQGVVAGWLRAGGLAFVATGVLGPRLGGFATPTGSLLLVLPPAPEAGLVAALAGAVGGARALLARPPDQAAAALIGLGLLLLGFAEVAATRSPVAGAGMRSAGALALGAWLWQGAARRLAAKTTLAIVATVLGVVVLLAASLSGLGAADLVEDELDRLEDRGSQIATAVGVTWPQEFVARIDRLSTSSALFGADLTAEGDVADVATPQERSALLEEVYASFYAQDQDFLVLLRPDGSTYAAAGGDLLDGAALPERLAGASVFRQLLDGAPSAAELLASGGRVIAVGGVRLVGDGAADSGLRGVLLTGRVLDEVYVEQESTRDAGLVVEADEGVLASSAVAAVAEEVLAALPPEPTRAAVQTDGGLRYASSSALRTTDGGAVGRVVAVSAVDGIAALERDQARRLFLLALLGTGLAGAVAAGLSSRLVGPVRRLTTAAAAVREGRLDVQPEVDSDDEVGVLGRTFAEMTRSLARQSTELREAAAQQSRLRARFEALTTSMGDALVAVDAEGRVLTFNPAAERLLGMSAVDAAGRRAAEVLVGTDLSGRPVDRSLALPGATVDEAPSRGVVVARLLLTRPDGHRLQVAVTVAPVRDGEGRPAGRVMVLRDQSREAEVDRMKSEFLANVSHELRTPLTPIRGYAEVLARRDVDSASTKAFATQILASTGRLERVVALIVDFAALDSGRLALRREPTALPDLVGCALSAWRDRDPGREFRRRLARALPAVDVDPAMLRRCLDELLDNAVKFSPGGEPVSVVGVFEPARNGAAPPRGPRVRLSVRDRGVGVDPEHAARVFGDFFQGDATETRHFGGLGLGLALVRRIIDGLGGEVELDSEPGAGSTVHLLLPVVGSSRGVETRTRPGTASG